MKMPWWFGIILAIWIVSVTIWMDVIEKKVDKIWADSYLSATVEDKK